MPVEFKKYLACELTVFKATGSVTLTDWIAVLEEYQGQEMTKNRLYDLTGLGGKRITPEHIEQLAWRVMNAPVLIPRGGKTAMVVAHQSDFGLTRVYQQLIDKETIGRTTRSFWNLDEACQWLGVDLAMIKEQGEDS
jgi:hypothetical protein